MGEREGRIPGSPFRVSWVEWGTEAWENYVRHLNPNVIDHNSVLHIVCGAILGTYIDFEDPLNLSYALQPVKELKHVAPLEHGRCWRLEKNYRNRYLLMCNTTANLSNTSTHSLTLSFQVQRSCKNNAASIVVMRSNHHAYGILSCQYLYQNTRGLFSTRNNSKIYTIDTKWSKAMTQTEVLFIYKYQLSLRNC